MMEKFYWLAAIIASHPHRTVVGRTRLQKTVRLLQRLGAPIDYDFTIHFYGPYSDGVSSDIGLLEKLGLVTETPDLTFDGSPFYRITGSSDTTQFAEDSNFKGYEKYIEIMSHAETTVLELAATYDAFREMGSNHDEALDRLRRKKGRKCDNGNLEEALKLLASLGFETQ